MCVTKVGRVVAVADDGFAAVADGFTTATVSLAPLILTGVRLAANDWVLVHSGLAVERLSDADAHRLLNALAAFDDGADP